MAGYKYQHIPNLRAVKQLSAVKGGAVVADVGKVNFRSASWAVNISDKSHNQHVDVVIVAVGAKVLLLQVAAGCTVGVLSPVDSNVAGRAGVELGLGTDEASQNGGARKNVLRGRHS